VHDLQFEENDVGEFYLKAIALLAQSYSATQNFVGIRMLYERALQNTKVEMPQERRDHIQSVLHRLRRIPVQNIPLPTKRLRQEVQNQSDEILVSAIVSTYNAEEFIRGCLEDLENQTIADKLEIIVVNSGSQQNEESIVREFQEKYSNIVYIKTEQKEGVYSAWNRAIKVARGRFLTNANTDDRHRKDALEILSKELINNPEIALVYADQICTETPNATFETHNAVETHPQPDYNRERLLQGCCVGSQPIWRSSLHKELGYFDETLDCAGDWDFWLRVSEKYTFKRVLEFLGLYYFNREGIEHGNMFHSYYERYAVGKRYGTEYISTFNTYVTERNWLVSVILPAYNAEKYISRAIESVLIQNYRHFELVIINDGSTDRTEEIINRYKDEHIRYFKQANRGLAATHNEGIRQSRGEFLIKVDADDFIAVDFIGRHLNEFYNHRDADLVYCDDYLVEENSKPIRIIERPEYADRRILIRDLFRAGFPVVPFRTCINRRVFEKIGLFDESLRIGEDYDMMKRFVKAGLKAQHLKAALYYRRMTSESLSRQYSIDKARAHFGIVKSYAETFSPDELFPGVKWELIPAGMRQMHFKCLVAMNFISLGRTYIETNLPSYARVALESAGEQLRNCLEIDPGNGTVKKLVGRCRQLEENLPQDVLVGV
jgi:glycosyltransferase involved in cell wall biosynthesis